MPQIIQRRNALGDAITAGTQGFLQGRQMRQQNEDRSIANAYRMAQMQELQRKSQALEAPIEDPNYFRDPASGKLYKRTTSMGAGGEIDPNLTATKFDKYGNPKEYENLQTRPLSGEASGKFSMAEQGIGNAQKIKDIYGFEDGAPGFKLKTLRAKAAGFQIPSINPAANLLEGAVQSFAGDEGRNLDLQYQTLAENLLRARTGAAATEPEIAREKQRLMARFMDSPEVALNRINEGENMLRGTAEGLRPGSTSRMTLPRNPGAVPSWVPKDFDYQSAIKAYGSPEAVLRELKKSGYVR